MRATLLLLAAAAAALAFAGQATAQPTELRNATLIDGTGAPPRPNTTIVIDGGRIADIRATPPGTANQAAPAGTTVVDLTGKFVTPGIINGHGHVGPAPRDRQLRQYALYGVTTTTSMASDPDDIVQYKAKQRAGEISGARILTVKYRFTTLRGGGDDDKTPEAARTRVDRIATGGADFIKVWLDAQGGRIPKLSREFVSAVFDQARKHGKRTMAHIVELADARMAVDEGVNILVHNVRDQEIPDDFIATLRQKNVSVISTLAREEGMFVYGNADAGFTDDPFFLKGLTTDQRAKLQEKRAAAAKESGRERSIRAFETDKANVRKLVNAGIRFGFGTDSGGAAERYFVQGYSEHRQMELLLASGLTPMQIIQTFSKTTSEILGIDGEFGTLATGKAADLLVLTGDPLADIRNMRTIEAVYLGGKTFQ